MLGNKVLAVVALAASVSLLSLSAAADQEKAIADANNWAQTNWYMMASIIR